MQLIDMKLKKPLILLLIEHLNIQIENNIYPGVQNAPGFIFLGQITLKNNQ
jgi:hypothetical protein